MNWSGSANDPGTTDSHRRHSLRRAMFFPCTGELREKQAATTHTGALHTRVARTHAAAQVSHQCYRRDKQGGVALVAAEVGKSAVGMRKRFEHFARAFGFPRARGLTNTKGSVPWLAFSAVGRQYFAPLCIVIPY